MSYQPKIESGRPAVDQETGLVKYRVRVYDKNKVNRDGSTGGYHERVVVGEAAAQRTEAELQGLKQENVGLERPFIASRCTLLELAPQYLAEYTQRRNGDARPLNSWRKDRHNLQAYILPTLGDKDINSFTPRVLDDFIKSIRLQNGEVPSDWTRTTVAGVLTRILKWAWRNGFTRTDKSDGMLKSWGGSSKRAQLIPSPYQVARLAECIDTFKPGLGDVCLVLAYTGMRWEEIAYLPLHAVDLERQQIRILGTASESGGKREVRHYEGKSAAAMRTIVIPDQGMPAVRRLYEKAMVARDHARAQARVMAARYPHQRAVVEPVEPFGRLVNGDRGGYISYNGMWRRYLSRAHDHTKVAWQDLGLNGPITYTAHELRHVAASVLIEAKVKPELIARQMGHKSADFTRRIYAHVMEMDLADLRVALTARYASLELAEAEEQEAA